MTANAIYWNLGQPPGEGERGGPGQQLLLLLLIHYALLELLYKVYFNNYLNRWLGH